LFARSAYKIFKKVLKIARNACIIKTVKEMNQTEEIKMKYDLKKIMNDAWHMMRANYVGGVYQISLSQALHFAWEVARRDLRKAECVKEIISSGKYDYIVKEENPMNRFDLVKKAFNALRAEGEERRAAFRNGMMSKAGLDEYLAIENSAEHSVLTALQSSCRKSTSRPVWNDSWPYALGLLPEEEF
jgi:hypothetical protein